MSRLRSASTSGLAAGVLLLACTGGSGLPGAGSGRAFAAEHDPAAPESAVPTVEAPRQGVELRLRRAAFELALGNLRGAIDELEALDYRDPDRHAELDRAAFLLAHALLASGDAETFLRLAEQVSTWRRDDPYVRWILRQRWLQVTASADPSERFGVPASDVSGVVDSALVAFLGAAGGDDEAAWVRASKADTTSELGRTIAGAAILERARRMLARGEDPRPLLDGMHPASPFSPRARHLSGVVALERGDLDEGSRRLEALLAEDPGYAGRLDVHLRLAARAMDEERWEEAYEHYRRADEEWGARRRTLDRAGTEGADDELWNGWVANDPRAGVLSLDGAVFPETARKVAWQILDSTARPGLESFRGSAPDHREPGAWTIPPPPAADRAALARSARAVAQARSDLSRVHFERRRVERRIERRRRHLELGRRRVAALGERLDAHLASLDSLRRRLDRLQQKLAGVHRATEGRLTARTERIRDRAARHRLWLDGMRHLHLEGPNRERPIVPPPGYPEPDVLVAEERELAERLRALGERMIAELPEVAPRTAERSAAKSLEARIARQVAASRDLLKRTREQARRFDALLAAAGESAALRTLAARAGEFERRVERLRSEHEALRSRVAGEAVRAALAALESDREAIDYGLAASTYGASLRTGSPVASPGASPIEPDPESPEIAAWRGRSIASLERFLERHPDSFARGEMRFRLADLLLVDARRGFQEEMARFVRAQEEGRGGSVTLPVLDYGRALALYEAILLEDPDFSHRDAVLFNAGMILADAGSPEAVRHFEDLVLVHRDSPFRQDAYLRLGDLSFQAGRYEESIAEYEQAGRGEDATLRIMALYKLGWARFNVDRFVEAADAFRLVLDEYEAAREAALSLDVEEEAEAYLVHSLARAGGAPAFERFFDRIGPRRYERTLLMALGQHFRRFSLFEEAASADRASLSRWPQHADALVSARRLLDTYRRWGRPEEVVDAQLELAPRFAPGSVWIVAQESDSVRAAGATFARDAWTAAAVHYHRTARESGEAEAWRHTLALYGSLFEYWPAAPDAPRLHLFAGEACAELGLYEDALDHYATAAEGGADSLAERALYQKLAVTDAWYESTREAGAGGRDLGDETLADAVLAAGDELLTRHPEHAKRADVLWRQGNLAFAHGRYDRAADELERLATAHPGDERAPEAAGLRAEALFRLERFADAERAFETTRRIAQRAGLDSLARRAEQAIPICAHREAEAALAADSTDHLRQAELFDRVAERWPDYEHASRSRYRAGLAYLEAGRTAEGLRAMETLIRQSPESEFARDAHLQVAEARKRSGDVVAAAEAYATFADRYRDDATADEALLEAASLSAGAGRVSRADELRLAYLRRYPEDHETTMEILEERARRELSQLPPERAISPLLGAAASGAPERAKENGGAFLPLAEYVQRAEAHPELASPPLLAEIRHREAEEARTGYEAVALTLPLPKSIAAKRVRLDTVIARHRRVVALGVSAWAHASAHRIGQALIAFGEALERSERPRDLDGDDLLAYEEVLLDEAQVFYDRGEAVWADLLRRNLEADTSSTWLARTRAALWKRLGERFFYRPEVEFPLVSARPPDPPPAPASPSSASLAPAGGGEIALPEAPRPENENR